MEKVGIVRHHTVSFDLPQLIEAREFLRGRNADVWEIERGANGESLQRNLRDTTLLLTAGGDGTLLYGARLVAPREIPLLGVNLGRVGFLTELEADQLITGLERFLQGDYWVEPRVMLQVDGRGELIALNEVLINREVTGKLVRLRVLIDGQEVGIFDADGVIVATATGSTAYALAAGGPVLDPRVEGLVLVPLTPFALTVRPIILPSSQRLTIELLHNDAMLAMDGGRLNRLQVGACISIQVFPRPLKFIKFSEQGHFYIKLREKLGWGLPLVPKI